MTQHDLVLQLVKAHPEGIRTEWVKILSMKLGISCPDRFLRYLAQEGLVRSEKFTKDRTKTWFPVKNESDASTSPIPGPERAVLAPNQLSKPIGQATMTPLSAGQQELSL